MSAQITPGPWYVYEDHSIKRIATEDEEANKRGFIATICQKWNDDEEEANARAIAALHPILEYLRLRAAGGDETAALLLLKAGQ